jgi:hypothetical protein
MFGAKLVQTPKVKAAPKQQLTKVSMTPITLLVSRASLSLLVQFFFPAVPPRVPASPSVRCRLPHDAGSGVAAAGGGVCVWLPGAAALCGTP